MSTVQYYPPRIADDDLTFFRGFAAAWSLKFEQEGKPSAFYDWLYLALSREQERREMLDADEPVDVEMLELPADWSGDDVGQAVIAANILAMLSWPRPVGQFVDAIVMAVNCRAAYLLKAVQ